MILSFVVLFTCTISKSYTEGPQDLSYWQNSFWRRGSTISVACPDLKKPIVSSILDQSPGWDEDRIYPVDVCADITTPIGACL